MTEKEELNIYRRFLNRLSLGLTTNNDMVVNECLEKARDWGYEHSNSIEDEAYNEYHRIKSIENLRPSPRPITEGLSKGNAKNTQHTRKLAPPPPCRLLREGELPRKPNSKR